MYPEEELAQLARRKVILRGSIAVNRWRCVASAKRVSEPLQWVDRGLAQWHRLSPFVKFAAFPLGFFFKRKIFPQHRILGSFSSLLKWAPAIFGAFKAYKGLRPSTPTS